MSKREETAPQVDQTVAPQGLVLDPKIMDVCEQWQTELMEHTPRNGGRMPILDLTHAHPSGLAQLYTERVVPLSNLLREPTAYKYGQRQLRALMQSAGARAAEYGIATIHLAVGVAYWLDSQSEPDANGKPTNEKSSPVFLRPVVVGGDENEYTVTLQPAVMVSPDLLQALKQARIDLTEDDLIRAAYSRQGFSPTPALDLLRTTCAQSDMQSVQIYEHLLVGLYANPLAAVIDAYDQPEKLQESTLVRALAGDRQACIDLDEQLPVFNGADRDPDQEKGIGDLDPTGQHILEVARAKRSFVVDAPPGTDIQGLVAALVVDQAMAQGSCLYTTTDLSNAHALVATLDAHRMRHLVADLTDARNWQKHLQESIQGALDYLFTTPPPSELQPIPDSFEGDDAQDLLASSAAMRAPMLEAQMAEASASDEANETMMDVTGMRTQLRARRDTMSRYTTHLHREHEVWGASPHKALQVLADLIGMHPAPRTKVRLPEEVCRLIHADGGAAARTALEDAAALGLFTPSKTRHAWRDAQIEDEQLVPEVVSAVEALQNGELSSLRLAMSRTASETGLRPATTLAAWQEQLEMLDGVREALDIFSPMIFERSAADMIIATATPKWRRDHGLNMGMTMRRRLTKQAKEMVRPGREIPDLNAALRQVQEQRQIWQRHAEAGGWPRLPGNLDQMKRDTEIAAAHVKLLSGALSTHRGDLTQMEVGDLAQIVSQLAQETAGAYSLPAWHEINSRIANLGLTEFVRDMQDRGVTSEMLVPELDLAWWASVLMLMLRDDSDFKAMDGPTLERLTAQLRDLDRAQVESLTGAVIRMARARTLSVAQAHATELDEVQDYLLDNRAPDMMLLLERHPWLWDMLPIRVMPPVLATQLFSSTFPSLVLDRVGMVPAAQMMPLLSRAQTVVALGDPRIVSGGLWQGLCEVLPHVQAPAARTRTHQSVATLLARHGYAQWVAPIPTPRPLSRISLVSVEGRGTPALGSSVVESTSPEVQRVVDMVIDHALTSPEQSLAVIALNERHAQLLSEAILSAVAGSLSVDAFFRTDKPEPFVVADPHNAQGIERDRIILSLGYGKTPHGRLIHDFGAVSQSEGKVLLASLLATVRNDLTVVTAFSLDDVDPKRMDTPGNKMLWDILQLAANNEGLDTGGWDTLSEAPDRLLVDLAERMYRMGLDVVPNLGIEGGFRIPLALGHPDVPGELLVAVLTDDPIYVREPSLRVRDRHVIERLEANGWVVKRVFSTAAFANPQAEAEALLETVLDAVDLRLGRTNGPDTNEMAPMQVPQDISDWEANEEAQRVAAATGAETSGEQSNDAGLASDDLAAGAQASADELNGVHEAEIQPEQSAEGADNAKAASSPADGVMTDESWQAVDSQALGFDRDDEMAGEAVSASANEIIEPDPVTGQLRLPGEDVGVEMPKMLANLQAKDRGPKPAIATGLPLSAYSDFQLDEMLRWVAADGLPRTEEQYVHDLHRALGLTRTGRQVNAVLGHVIRRNSGELHWQETTVPSFDEVLDNQDD
ncbi:hypothetical protein BK816_02335 [Boudabousia tangfeifanii]|uniref:Restriction endonuclease type II-like domain-containing protein n=1 Tax=Boudabousia tangfeifanii TaxID=1912795 RepID=A0A1D9MIW3_9ACTO|nr:hypothetical protein [Boudabousia tangfeifanii]AOZ72281.1 hypothetical protein BK816_02335 [Boudabousia tangfeifanii]